MHTEEEPSKVLEDLRPKITAVPRGTRKTHEERVRGRGRSCWDIISQGFLSWATLQRHPAHADLLAGTVLNQL